MGIAGAVCLGVAASSRAQSESPFSQELNRATIAHQDAVAAAVGPLEKRYQKTLELLLSRATKAGDLDGAVAIRAALDKLKADRANRIDPATVKTRKDLEAALVGTTWTMARRKEDAAEAAYVFSFVSTKAIAYPDSTSPWRATAKREVEEGPNGEATLIFDESLESYYCAEYHGSGPRYGVRK